MWKFWRQQKNSTSKIELRWLRYDVVVRSHSMARQIRRIFGRENWCNKSTHSSMQRAYDIFQHRQFHRSTLFSSSFVIYIFVYRFYAIRIAKCFTHARNKKRDLIPEHITRIACVEARMACEHGFFRLLRWAYFVLCWFGINGKKAKWKSCVNIRNVLLNTKCCEPSIKDGIQPTNWDGFILYFCFVSFFQQALKPNHISITQQIIGIRSTEWAMILLQHLQFQIVRMEYLKST